MIILYGILLSIDVISSVLKIFQTTKVSLFFSWIFSRTFCYQLVFPGLYCHVQTLSQPFLQQNTAIFSPFSLQSNEIYITCSNVWKCQNRMSFIMNFRFRCILFKTFWNFPYMWFRISGCAGDVIWLRISRGVKAAILVTSIWDSFWVIWKISLNHKHQGS